MVRSYCEPLKRAEVDTVILGCTHYPLVRPMLQRVLGREVRLVTAGHAIAATVERQLASAGLARTGNEEGTYRFLCTDDPDSFRELGTRFLQMPLGDIEWGVLMIIVGLYLVGVAALIAAGRREDARALAGFIPDCLVLVSRLARDRRVSRVRRAVLFVVLGYLALPIDLVPDFLPGIGHLDDAVLLGLALRLVVHGGGTELVREAWPGPQASLTLVLRAAGLETNGAATPPTTL
jgi:uncharacterized membrane protein YkvA (DUF1232 family)